MHDANPIDFSMIIDTPRNYRKHVDVGVEAELPPTPPDVQNVYMQTINRKEGELAKAKLDLFTLEVPPVPKKVEEEVKIDTYKEGGVRAKMDQINKIWNTAEYRAAKGAYVQDQLALNNAPVVSELLIAQLRRPYLIKPDERHFDRRNVELASPEPAKRKFQLR